MILRSTFFCFCRFVVVLGMTPMDVVEKIGNPCSIETPAPVEALHSLLDKTAVYSKFVSSQIKDVGLATIQGQQQGTGEAASSGKRKGAPAAGSSKKAKAQTNAAPCHGIITTPDLLLARLQGAKGGGKNTEGKYEGQSKYITGGEQRDYQKQGTLSFRRPLAALSFRRQF